jgi:hypothetical protein
VNTTPYDAINALYSTTFHGELIQAPDTTRPPAKETPPPVSIEKAVESFEKWWDANKDKSEAEWAMAGMEEWIQRARDFIAGQEGAAYPMQSANSVLANSIVALVQSEIGNPPSTGRPQSTEDYQTAFLQRICDWWDKNKDRVTWDAEKRRFIVKQEGE